MASSQIVQDVVRSMATPVFVGLAAHFVYRKWEPNVFQFITQLAMFSGPKAMTLSRIASQGGLELLINTFYATAIYLAALGMSITVYRVYFHPLRSYPGPLLCKLTRFTATWHVLTRDSPFWIMELHSKYGDVVRVSPNELSYVSASSVERIHGAKAGRLARGPFYSGDPNRPADSMLSTQDIAEHRWRRRGWEQGFGTSKLRDYEPRVIQHLDTLILQFEKRVNETVDMTEWCEFFAYDVMSDLAFSEDFGMLNAAAPHRYISALHGATRILVIAAQTPWIRPLMQFFPVDRQSKIDGKKFASISRATYDQMRNKKVDQIDLYGFLSAGHVNGARSLTEAELIADTSLLIAAGAVSTALCITFAFSHLCDNREQLTRLHEEIDRCWDGVSPLQASMLGPEKAPFLNGVIHKSLRLWPPAPIGIQRRTPPGSYTIDDRVVPGETQISVHTMIIMRDERHFSKPERVMPERWIDDERPKDFNHDTDTFILFTIGQYACLSKNLALQEIRLFIARVLRPFDIAYPENHDSAAFYRDLWFKGTFKAGKLPIVISKRQERC